MRRKSIFKRSENSAEFPPVPTKEERTKVQDKEEKSESAEVELNWPSDLDDVRRRTLVVPENPVDDQSVTSTRGVWRRTLIAVAIAFAVLILVASLVWWGLSEDKSRSSISEDTDSEDFQKFMMQFNKVYRSAEEKSMRFSIFRQNAQIVKQHNAHGRVPLIGDISARFFVATAF